MPSEVQLERSDNSNLQINLRGDWTRNAKTPEAEATLREIGDASRTRRVVLRADGLQQWDSKILTFLIKLIDHGKEEAIEIELDALPEGIRGLLNLAYAVPERAGARRQSRREPILAQLGNTVLATLQDSKLLVEFIGESILSGLNLVTGRARFRRIDLLLNVQECGPGALPIVTLISLLVGLILAFVGAVQLAMFGAEMYIADLVALGMVREMGALMTAVIMSGRTGAAFAAQLGTMQVNSEIDALKTMGISPMEFLVLPRMLALIVAMPILCLYSDLLGILGGALVTVTFFDVTLVQFYNEAKNVVHFHDIAVGVIKCTVFGILIALAGCMRGMQCGRSASAVGDAATSAVVTSIVFIVVSDSILTLLFDRLNF